MKRVITLDRMTVAAALKLNTGWAKALEKEKLRQAAHVPGFRRIDHDQPVTWHENGTYSFTAIYQ